LSYLDEWVADLRVLVGEMGEAQDDQAAADRSRVDAELTRVGATRREIWGRFELELTRLKAALGLPFHAKVKVLDIQTGRRTFPHPTALTQNGAGEPGHRMLVEMERLSAETVTSNEAEVFANKLAQEVALQVSRYFYDWRKPGFASQIQ